MNGSHPQVQGHGAEAMRLVCYAELHPSECKIGNRRKLADRLSCVAVCDAGAEGVYTFICDGQWRVVFDEWGVSVDDAVEGARQAWPLSRWVSPE